MGMKHSDLHECSQLNELKVDMSVLNMIAAWHLSGDNILVEQMPIVGGYSGGLEETAICDVASTIASFAFLNADIHLGGPIHIRWGTTTNRQSLQVAAHTAMAIDTNTDLLLANQYYTLAGPCTEMNLLETAAQAMCDTVCGRELLSGEAAMASCGIEVHEANEILDRIVSWYEKFYFKVPAPKRFQECYNVDEITPTEEYMSVYDSSLNILSNCGIDF